MKTEAPAKECAMPFILTFGPLPQRLALDHHTSRQSKKERDVA
jgi:hypothetical protein